MKILVAGGGAVGSYLAGKLSLAKHDVVVLNRNLDYCGAVNRRGLTIVDEGVSSVASVRAYLELSDLFNKEGEFSLAIITVKGFSTRGLFESMSSYFQHVEHYLSVQNGLGNEETILSFLSPDWLTAGSLTTAVTIKQPGRVEAENRGGLALASILPGSPPGWEVDLFKKARFRIQVRRDWKSMKWSKLLLNILANATCALFDMSAEEVFGNPATFRLEREAFLEAVSIMKANGLSPVSLPCQPVPFYAWAIRTLPEALLRAAFKRKMAKGRGNKLASLHLDFVQGKKETEWPYLYGALVESAREKGIKAPVLETICFFLEEVSSGRIARQTLWKNPELVIRQVLEAKRGLTR